MLISITKTGLEWLDQMLEEMKFTYLGQVYDIDLRPHIRGVYTLRVINDMPCICLKKIYGYEIDRKGNSTFDFEASWDDETKNLIFKQGDLDTLKYVYSKVDPKEKVLGESWIMNYEPFPHDQASTCDIINSLPFRKLPSTCEIEYDVYRPLLSKTTHIKMTFIETPELKIYFITANKLFQVSDKKNRTLYYFHSEDQPIPDRSKRIGSIKMGKCIKVPPCGDHDIATSDDIEYVNKLVDAVGITQIKIPEVKTTKDAGETQVPPIGPKSSCDSLPVIESKSSCDSITSNEHRDCYDCGGNYVKPLSNITSKCNGMWYVMACGLICGGYFISSLYKHSHV